MQSWEYFRKIYALTVMNKRTKSVQDVHFFYATLTGYVPVIDPV